jgi:hypothetical protein
VQANRMNRHRKASIAARVGPILLVGMLLASLAPAAYGSTAATPAEQTKTTKSYVFKLTVEMPQQMWTPAQVRAKHPTSGEVMLGGSMSTAMSMGGSARHVEVKIAKRPTGKVVTGAHPTITLVDTQTSNPMAVKLPVMMMRGVDEGSADIHYGNNVNLVVGHLYRVSVTLAGEKAVFQAKAPKG